MLQAIYSDVWSSSDGINWTRVIEAAAFGHGTGRIYHGSVVWNDKMWVVGGKSNVYRSDVWNSSDGVTWVEVTPAAGWAARTDIGLALHRNRM